MSALLGVQGTIVNQTLEQLVAENRELKRLLTEAASLIVDQKAMLDQIKQELNSGQLYRRPANQPG